MWRPHQAAVRVCEHRRVNDSNGPHFSSESCTTVIHWLSTKTPRQQSELLIRKTNRPTGYFWYVVRCFLPAPMKRRNSFSFVFSGAAVCCCQFDTARMCDDKRDSGGSLVIPVVRCFVGVMMLQSSESAICSHQSVWTPWNYPQNRRPTTVNLYVLVYKIFLKKSQYYYSDYTKKRDYKSNPFAALFYSRNSFENKTHRC